MAPGSSSEAPRSNSQSAIDDPMSPYFLHHSDNPGLTLVSQSLTGDNYSSWSRAMKIALSVKNKYGFVDGTIVKPSELVRADVSTIALGISASTASIILGGGTKGKRFAMPNTRIMIHQPLGGASGQAIDVEIQAKEVMHNKKNITGIISDCSGRSFEQVEKDIDRDHYMSPIEAVEYGLIDGVIDRDSITPLEPVPERVKPSTFNYEEISKDPKKFLTPDIPDDEIY